MGGKAVVYGNFQKTQSIGYWDFWQKQSRIPGQDCETVCGLLDSIKGKTIFQNRSGSWYR